jgi:PAS domain S-box-containing protein
MTNHPKSSKGTGASNTRKIVVSILLGLAGFAGSGLALEFSAPPFTLSIDWSHIFPLIAAMSYGAIYGVAAGAIGLAAWTPFMLWHTNGWANVLASLALILWYAWHGFAAQRREQHKQWWNNLLVAQSAFAILYYGIIHFGYPIAFGFNPAPWSLDSFTEIPANVLEGILIKSTLTMYLTTLTAAFLMSVPQIRKLFGLEIFRNTKFNGAILIGSFVIAVLIWGLLERLNNILSGEPAHTQWLQHQDMFEIMTLLMITCACVTAGYIISIFAEKRFNAEEDAREDENYYRMIFNSGRDAIFVHEMKADGLPGIFTEVNDIACQQLGYTRDELLTMSPMDINTPESAVTIPNDSQNLREYGYALFERVRRAKDGRRFTAEINARLFERDGKNTIVSIARDITDRKQTAETLNALLREKDILLAEVHHRVKNNLQIIVSLLDLQARTTEDALTRSALEENRNRIRSMALIHEELYHEHTFDRIHFARYLDGLCAALYRTYEINPSRVSIRIDAGEISFALDTAITCGLLMNEIISNSLKHAFPGERSGTIRIGLRVDADRAELIAADDGIGLPLSINLENPNHLGMYLIRLLVTHDLHGSFDLRSEPGVSYRIQFPLAQRAGETP